MTEVDTLVIWCEYKPDPEPGATWHNWLGSKPNPGDDAKLFVLCWRVTGKMPADFENYEKQHVTLSNAHVTCQECSELIHA